jgi:hypothetical protein
MLSKTQFIKQKWICTYVKCSKINKTNERRNHRWNCRPVATWHVRCPDVCAIRVTRSTRFDWRNIRCTSGAVWPWVTERSVMCWDMLQSTDNSKRASCQMTLLLLAPRRSGNLSRQDTEIHGHDVLTAEPDDMNSMVTVAGYMTSVHFYVPVLLCGNNAWPTLCIYIYTMEQDRCLHVKISNDFSSCTKLSQFPIRMWLYILFERFPPLLMGKFLVVTYSRQHCKGRSEGAAKPVCSFCALRLHYLGGTLRRHTSFS